MSPDSPPPNGLKNKTSHKTSFCSSRRTFLNKKGHTNSVGFVGPQKRRAFVGFTKEDGEGKKL